MVIGLGIIVFRLHDCHSLKAKRSVTQKIVHQIRNHFNASVAEVGANDQHGRAEIGFALVGNDRQVINAKIDKVFNFAEDLGVAEVIDTEMELINI